MHVDEDIDIFGSPVADPHDGSTTGLAVAGGSTKVVLKTLPNGVQVPVNAGNVLTNADLVDSLTHAVTSQYDGSNPRHMGKTKLQAGMDALVDKFAAGDKEAAVIVMERIGGKPTQVTKQLTVNTDLQTFLESCQ